MSRQASSPRRPQPPGRTLRPAPTAATAAVHRPRDAGRPGRRLRLPCRQVRPLCATRQSLKRRRLGAARGKMGVEPVSNDASDHRHHHGRRHRRRARDRSEGAAASRRPRTVPAARNRRHGTAGQGGRALGLEAWASFDSETGRSAIRVRRAVDCIDLGLVPANIPYGKVSASAGEAAYRYIELAVRLALEGAIGAVCHRADEQGGAARRRPSCIPVIRRSSLRSPAPEKCR